MTQPILPPRPSQLAAYLRAGDTLVHRSTRQRHVIDRVDYCRTERVTPTQEGEHHVVGTTLAVKIGDTIYGEYHRPSLERLWEDYERPVLADIDGNNHFVDLNKIEVQAGFHFYPGQRDLIARVATRPGALIAAETGAGKTLIGIALAYVQRPTTCLILVPQGVLRQWQDEFARFWPGQELRRLKHSDIRDSRLPNGIWLAYHEEFLLNDGGLIKHLAPDAFDMVLIDEVHLRQNPDTAMGNEIWSLTPRLRYALTATPIPNRIADIYPICRWLRPDLTYKHNDQREWIQLNDGGRRELQPTAPLSPAIFAWELNRVVAAVRKVDLRPDMPPMNLTVHRIAMDAAQRKIYDETELWCPKRGNGGTVIRLRQSKLRNACTATGSRNNAVLKRILQIVAAGEQVVVGCARIEQSNWIARQLKSVNIGFTRIDSTMPAGKHQIQAARFKGKGVSVLLIGVRCAYGYSFSECSHGILASPEWGYGTVLQFFGRFYRLNSQRPVTCEVFICENSIEERMVYDLGLKEVAANTVLFGSEAMQNIIIDAVVNPVS